MLSCPVIIHPYLHLSWDYKCIDSNLAVKINNCCPVMFSEECLRYSHAGFFFLSNHYHANMTGMQ